MQPNFRVRTVLTAEQDGATAPRQVTGSGVLPVRAEVDWFGLDGKRRTMVVPLTAQCSCDNDCRSKFATTHQNGKEQLFPPCNGREMVTPLSAQRRTSSLKLGDHNPISPQLYGQPATLQQQFHFLSITCAT